MLERVMDFIHNYFVKDVYYGTFVIRGGELDVNFLMNNQYFKIVGSTFNDGVHQYISVVREGSTNEPLIDETFTGQVWAMAVPPTFIALVGQIEAWVNKYGEQVLSPFSSESFGGYSYTKAQGNRSDGSTPTNVNWQDVFRSSLNHWRKIA